MEPIEDEEEEQIPIGMFNLCGDLVHTYHVEEDKDYYQEMLDEDRCEDTDWAQVEAESDVDMDEDQEDQLDHAMEPLNKDSDR